MTAGLSAEDQQVLTRSLRAMVGNLEAMHAAAVAQSGDQAPVP